MGIKFTHSYNIVGTPATPVALTATLSDNSKTVMIKDLPNQMVGISYVPHAGQTGRYAYVTIEVSNDPTGPGLPASTSWKPFSAGVVSSNPNEVDVIPVVSIAGTTFGTPIVLPANSGAPSEIASTTYSATYNLSLIGNWMRISIAESGSGNNGTANVSVAISE